MKPTCLNQSLNPQGPGPIHRNTIIKQSYEANSINIVTVVDVYKLRQYEKCFYKRKNNIN